MTADVPELRIIDHEMWEKVRQRREERTIDGHYSTRPRHLFSGLLKCGRCGSGYIVSGADKRGRYLRCSRMLETGLCNNKRTIGLQWVKSQIIQGIEAHLASPDLIAEYVREYHREWTKLRDSADRRRSELSRSLAGIKRDTKLAVDALLHNPTSRSIQERLAELEKERDKAEAQLADVAPPPIFEFHPNMADSYRKKVQDLRAALAACDEEDRADATAAIRELVKRVTIIPSDPYKPVELKIHGRLATLLEASREGAIKRPESMGGLVAGERNPLYRTVLQYRR